MLKRDERDDGGGRRDSRSDGEADAHAVDERRSSRLVECLTRDAAEPRRDVLGAADRAEDGVPDRGRHVGRHDSGHLVLVAGDEQAADDGDAESAADLQEGAVGPSADAVCWRGNDPMTDPVADGMARPAPTPSSTMPTTSSPYVEAVVVCDSSHSPPLMKQSALVMVTRVPDRATSPADNGATTAMAPAAGSARIPASSGV